jgi:hypothetical protein
MDIARDASIFAALTGGLRQRSVTAAVCGVIME